MEMVQPQIEQIAEKKKREYSLTEVIFAWLSMLAGYAFCRTVPVSASPFGAVLYTIALFAVTTAIVVKRGVRLKGASIAAMAAAIVVSLSLFFTSNESLHFAAYVFVIATYCYFMFACFGNTLEQGYSEFVLVDYFKALFVTPFVSLGEVFLAMASGNNKKHGKVALKVLLGVAIAIVPSAIVISLLSYDKGFTKILNSIFRFTPGQIASHIFSALFGVLVGMFIFSAYVSACDKKCSDVLSIDECRRAAKKVRVISAVTAATATLPLLAVYVIFFISQWKYYVSGFVGVLPDSTSYAQYAREGFFQLCTVAVINLIVIFSIYLFMRRNGKGVVMRILSLAFSAATLALISTAIAKMVLYINRYGLTPKRVYSSWFMLVLAVVFLLVCVKQFAPKFKIVATTFFVTVAMFALLGLSGADSIIANYNVNAYLSGKLDSVDVYALEDLGDSAVPSLVRLARHYDKENGTSIAEQIKLSNSYDDDYNYYIYEDEELQKMETYDQVVRVLKEYASDNKDNSLFSLSLPRIKARAALRSAKIIK